jgi:hypothetical protein
MARFARFALAALLPLGAWAQETIVLRDGGRFDGRLTAVQGDTVVFRMADGSTRRFNAQEVDTIRFGEPERQAGGPVTAREGNSGDSDGRGYTRRLAPPDYLLLPAGTPISVRTSESIDTRDAAESRTYTAQLTQDVVDGSGRVAIPRGSDAQLIVHRTGHDLVLDLQSVSVAGRRYLVDSNDIEQSGQREGVGANKRTAEYGGGGAVLGTLLGAIASGGKGAAIGAFAGGAAGVGTEVLTRGSAVRVPAETILSFRLDSAMSLRPARP